MLKLNELVVGNTLHIVTHRYTGWVMCPESKCKVVEASDLGPSQTSLYCVLPFDWLWFVSFCYYKTVILYISPPPRYLIRFVGKVFFFPFKSLCCLNMKLQLMFILILKQLHNDSFVSSFPIFIPWIYFVHFTAQGLIWGMFLGKGFENGYHFHVLRFKEILRIFL